MVVGQSEGLEDGLQLLEGEPAVPVAARRDVSKHFDGEIPIAARRAQRLHDGPVWLREFEAAQPLIKPRVASREHDSCFSSNRTAAAS